MIRGHRPRVQKPKCAPRCPDLHGGQSTGASIVSRASAPPPPVPYKLAHAATARAISSILGRRDRQNINPARYRIGSCRCQSQIPERGIAPQQLPAARRNQRYTRSTAIPALPQNTRCVGAIQPRHYAAGQPLNRQKPGKSPAYKSNNPADCAAQSLPCQTDRCDDKQVQIRPGRRRNTGGQKHPPPPILPGHRQILQQSPQLLPLQHACFAKSPLRSPARSDHARGGDQESIIPTQAGAANGHAAGAVTDVDCRVDSIPQVQ